NRVASAWRTGGLDYPQSSRNRESLSARANISGVALRGYGYGEKLRAASVVAPHSAANRIEYRHDGLTDWYVNGPLGLEQGFTLEHAPTSSQLEPLTVVFDLSGDLDAAVDPDERGLTLEKAGTAVLRYRGLTAMDAGGRELRAWLEVVDRRLRVKVDDA